MKMLSAVVEWVIELFGWLWRFGGLFAYNNKHYSIKRQDWEDFVWWVSFRQLPRDRRERADKVRALQRGDRLRRK